MSIAFCTFHAFVLCSTLFTRKTHNGSDSDPRFIPDLKFIEFFLNTTLWIELLSAGNFTELELVV